MTWRRPAWLVPIGVFLATFGVFSVRHPGSVKAMLASTRGLAMTLGALVIVVIFLFAARLRPAIERIAPYVLTLGVLSGAMYAEVPFERTSTQNKTLVAGPVVDADVKPAPTSTIAPHAEPTVTPTTTTARQPLATAPPTTALPQRSAVRHSTGELKGINHTASGAVSVIESAEGAYVLRFENFTVQGSPAPVLYLIEGEDEESPGGTNLGAFGATDGTTLDVGLPAEVKPGPGWTVLIWCEKFATPIANATQQ